MTNEEREIRLAAGICPDCGGRLDTPHPSRNIFKPGKQRQCYDCMAIFHFQPQEG